MKKILATLILFLALSGGAKAATTTTLNFDDIDTGTSGAVNFTSYTDSFGITSTWTDWGVMNPHTYNTQYEPAIHSESQIAWNGYGQDATISFDQAVNLMSGYFTSAYYSPNNITISGTYATGSTFSFTDFISLSPTGNQEFVNFGLHGITSITFSPDVIGFPDERNWFGMDDLVYCTPVPEPASVALGLISLTGLLGARRRKSGQA